MSIAEEEHDLISFEGIKHFAEIRLGPQAAKRALDKASKEILAGNKLCDVVLDGNTGAQAKCMGSDDGVYNVSVRGQELTCSCPAGQKNPVCKHGLSLLLWRVQHRATLLPSPPGSSTAAPSAPTLPAVPPNDAHAMVTAPTQGRRNLPASMASITHRVATSSATQAKPATQLAASIARQPIAPRGRLLPATHLHTANHLPVQKQRAIADGEPVAAKRQRTVTHPVRMHGMAILNMTDETLVDECRAYTEEAAAGEAAPTVHQPLLVRQAAPELPGPAPSQSVARPVVQTSSEAFIQPCVEHSQPPEPPAFTFDAIFSNL